MATPRNLCWMPALHSSRSRSKGEQQARGTLVWKEIWAGDLEGAAALTLTARMKRLSFFLVVLMILTPSDLFIVSAFKISLPRSRQTQLLEQQEGDTGGFLCRAGCAACSFLHSPGTGCPLPPPPCVLGICICYSLKTTPKHSSGYEGRRHFRDLGTEVGVGDSVCVLH